MTMFSSKLHPKYTFLRSHLLGTVQQTGELFRTDELLGLQALIHCVPRELRAEIKKTLTPQRFFFGGIGVESEVGPAANYAGTRVYTPISISYSGSSHIDIEPEHPELSALLSELERTNATYGVLVTGPMGSGKTTACLKAMNDCIFAERETTGPLLNGLLPIRISVPDTLEFPPNQKQDELFLVACSSGLNSSPAELERVRHYLSNCPPLLVLCDLNAISARHLERVIAALRKLQFGAPGFPRCRVVVACRSVQRLEPRIDILLAGGLFEPFNLRPVKTQIAAGYLENIRLVEEEISSHFGVERIEAGRNRTELVVELLRRVARSRGNESLLSTPLFMHLLTVVPSDSIPNINTVSDLYGYVVTAVLARNRRDYAEPNSILFLGRQGEIRLRELMSRLSLLMLSAESQTTQIAFESCLECLNHPESVARDGSLFDLKDFTHDTRAAISLIWRNHAIHFSEDRDYLNAEEIQAFFQFSLLKTDGHFVEFIHDSFAHYFASLTLCRSHDTTFRDADISALSKRLCVRPDIWADVSPFFVQCLSEKNSIDLFFKMAALPARVGLLDLVMELFRPYDRSDAIDSIVKPLLQHADNCRRNPEALASVVVNEVLKHNGDIELDVERDRFLFETARNQIDVLQQVWGGAPANKVATVELDSDITCLVPHGDTLLVGDALGRISCISSTSLKSQVIATLDTEVSCIACGQAGVFFAGTKKGSIYRLSSVDEPKLIYSDHEKVDALRFYGGDVPGSVIEKSPVSITCLLVVNEFDLMVGTGVAGSKEGNYVFRLSQSGSLPLNKHTFGCAVNVLHADVEMRGYWVGFGDSSFQGIGAQGGLAFIDRAEASVWPVSLSITCDAICDIAELQGTTVAVTNDTTLVAINRQELCATIVQEPDETHRDGRFVHLTSGDYLVACSSRGMDFHIRTWVLTEGASSLSQCGDLPLELPFGVKSSSFGDALAVAVQSKLLIYSPKTLGSDHGTSLVDLIAADREAITWRDRRGFLSTLHVNSGEFYKCNSDRTSKFGSDIRFRPDPSNTKAASILSDFGFLTANACGQFTYIERDEIVTASVRAEYAPQKMKSTNRVVSFCLQSSDFHFWSVDNQVFRFSMNPIQRSRLAVVPGKITEIVGLDDGSAVVLWEPERSELRVKNEGLDWTVSTISRDGDREDQFSTASLPERRKAEGRVRIENKFDIFQRPKLQKSIAANSPARFYFFRQEHLVCHDSGDSTVLSFSADILAVASNKAGAFAVTTADGHLHISKSASAQRLTYKLDAPSYAVAVTEDIVVVGGEGASICVFCLPWKSSDCGWAVTNSMSSPFVWPNHRNSNAETLMRNKLPISDPISVETVRVVAERLFTETLERPSDLQEFIDLCRWWLKSELSSESESQRCSVTLWLEGLLAKLSDGETDINMAPEALKTIIAARVELLGQIPINDAQRCQGLMLLEDVKKLIEAADSETPQEATSNQLLDLLSADPVISSCADLVFQIRLLQLGCTHLSRKKRSRERAAIIRQLDQMIETGGRWVERDLMLSAYAKSLAKHCGLNQALIVTKAISDTYVWSTTLSSVIVSVIDRDEVESACSAMCDLVEDDDVVKAYEFCRAVTAVLQRLTEEIERDCSSMAFRLFRVCLIAHKIQTGFMRERSELIWVAGGAISLLAILINSGSVASCEYIYCRYLMRNSKRVHSEYRRRYSSAIAQFYAFAVHHQLSVLDEHDILSDCTEDVAKIFALEHSIRTFLSRKELRRAEQVIEEGTELLDTLAGVSNEAKASLTTDFATHKAALANAYLEKYFALGRDCLQYVEQWGPGKIALLATKGVPVPMCHNDYYKATVKIRVDLARELINGDLTADAFRLIREATLFLLDASDNQPLILRADLGDASFQKLATDLVNLLVLICTNTRGFDADLTKHLALASYDLVGQLGPRIQDETNRDLVHLYLAEEAYHLGKEEDIQTWIGECKTVELRICAQVIQVLSFIRISDFEQGEVLWRQITEKTNNLEKDLGHVDRLEHWLEVGRTQMLIHQAETGDYAEAYRDAASIKDRTRYMNVVQSCYRRAVDAGDMKFLKYAVSLTADIAADTDMQERFEHVVGAVCCHLASLGHFDFVKELSEFIRSKDVNDALMRELSQISQDFIQSDSGSSGQLGM
ncbi:hypothetical protein [Gimesia maris]|uniref:hypothetical protein n=1 Tax=Gimesia maris TaxID=122 RepID=UPI0032EEC6C6